MASSLDFTLKIIDRATGPAKSVSRALGKVKASADKVQRTTAGDKLATQMNKATASTDKLWRAQQKAQAKIDAAAAAEQRARAKAAKSAEMSAQRKARADQRAAQVAQEASRKASRAAEKEAAARQKAAAASKNASSQAGESSGIFDKLGASISSITGVSGPAGAALAKIGAAAGAAALAVAALATAIVVKFGAAVLKAAGFAQKFSKSLGAVAGSAELGEKEFENVTRLAAEMGLEMRSTVEEYQRLRNVGFAADEAENIVKLTSDLRALGVRAESVGSIMNALGKIRAQGKLQGDELMMLAEAGVNVGIIYDSMADQLGVTRDEIIKMQAAGELTDEIALPAIEQAILQTVGSTEAGAVGKELADSTMGGFISKSKAQFELWKMDIGKQITPGIMNITGLVGDMMDRLSESGKLDQLTEGIVGAFQKVIKWVEMNWPTIELAITMGIDAMIVALDAFEWIWDNIISKIEPETWRMIGKQVLYFAAAVAILTVGLLALLAMPLLLVVAIGMLGVFLADLARRFVEWSAEMADSAWQAGKDIVQGIIDGLWNMFGPLMGTVSNIGSSIISGLRNSVDAHSPSREAMRVGQYTGQGLTGGIESTTPMAASAAMSMGSSVTSGLASTAIAPSVGLPQVAAGSATGGGGGLQFGGMTINVSAQPGATQADGEALADGLAPRIREEMSAILEDAVLSLGV